MKLVTSVIFIKLSLKLYYLTHLKLLTTTIFHDYKYLIFRLNGFSGYQRRLREYDLEQRKQCFHYLIQFQSLFQKEEKCF